MNNAVINNTKNNNKTLMIMNMYLKQVYFIISIQTYIKNNTTLAPYVYKKKKSNNICHNDNNKGNSYNDNTDHSLSYDTSIVITILLPTVYLMILL